MRTSQGKEGSSKHTKPPYKASAPSSKQPHQHSAAPTRQELTVGSKITGKPKIFGSRTNIVPCLPSCPKEIKMSTPFARGRSTSWQCHLCLAQDNKTKYKFKKVKECPIHKHKVADCKRCIVYPLSGKHSYLQGIDEDSGPPWPSISSDTIGFANNIWAIAGHENEGHELVLPKASTLADFEKEGRRNSILGSKGNNGAGCRSS